MNAPSPIPAPGGKPGETYGQMLLDRVVAGVSGSEKPLMFTAQLPARVARVHRMAGVGAPQRRTCARRAQRAVPVDPPE